MNTQNIIQNFSRLREDFPLYCRINVWIKDAGGRLLKLIFNKLQVRLWQLFKEDWNNPEINQVRWMLVKMRKGGASTFFIALFYWLSSLFPNKNSLIVAHDEPAALMMLNTMQTFYLRSEKVLRPNYRTMNRKEIYFANPVEEAVRTGDIGLDSHIDAATIDTKTLGRAYTYQHALLTEFAQYPELGVDIKERMIALFNAVPDEAGIKSFIILESTARGENDAKDFWYDDTNGFRKIFIGCVASEKYRKEISIDQYFELSELPDSRYGDEIAERKLYIKEIKFWYPEISTEVELEHEVMCRLYWRRYAIDVKCFGSKEKFDQEYPVTVEKAFAGTSNSIFPMDRILEMEDFINKSKFKSISFRYHHDDETKDPTRKFYEAKYGHLTIYEPPIPGAVYILSADGAQGVQDGDDSSAMVFKLPNLEEVACFSDIIIPTEFAGIVNYLGILYNTALVGVEINDKGGYTVMDRLLNDYHYSNLYYSINPLSSKYENNIKWGWYTGPKTRPTMIDDFTYYLDNGDILIKSKKVLTQCKSFVMINGKAQASSGKHDDLVITAMIGVQLSKVVHIPRQAPPPTKAPKWSIDWQMERMQMKAGQRKTFSRSFR